MTADPRAAGRRPAMAASDVPASSASRAYLVISIAMVAAVVDRRTDGRRRRRPDRRRGVLPVPQRCRGLEARARRAAAPGRRSRATSTAGAPRRPRAHRRRARARRLPPRRGARPRPARARRARAHERRVTADVRFTVNGARRRGHGDPMRRLTDVLRDDLGLTGTKVGCDAGDCGACTVRLDGDQVCACLVPLGQLGRPGGRHGRGARGRAARSRAADGVPRPRRRPVRACTPGMLMAADALLEAHPSPTGAEVQDALGGVLCRCTGYRRSWTRSGASSPWQAAAAPPRRDPAAGGRGRCADRPCRRRRPGHRRQRVRADDSRPVRSPCGPSARPTRMPGSPSATSRRSTPPSRSRPGPHRGRRSGHEPLRHLRHGQGPAGARRRLRPLSRRGGRRARRRCRDGRPIADDEVPIAWDVLPPLPRARCGRGPARAQLHEDVPGNLLAAGRVVRGDVDTALAARGRRDRDVRDAYVEHAYIEPEAGYARATATTRRVYASTQTPYMDRDELALIIGFAATGSRSSPAPAAAGSAGSWTCRSSRSSRSRPGCWNGRSGASTRDRSRCARRRSGTRRGSRPRSARTRTAA